MTYKNINPPFTLKFHEMPKKELQNYYRWFLDIIPARMDELAQTVRESAGFEKWMPDCTPGSLNTLGDWFATQVELRKRTVDEIAELKANNKSQFPVDPSAEDLSFRTFSLAVDIGMYLGQVLLANCPSLKWEHALKGKSNADYGQPVLVDFAFGPCNPVHLVVTLAYGISQKSRTGSRLRELYDIWSDKVK